MLLRVVEGVRGAVGSRSRSCRASTTARSTPGSAPGARRLYRDRRRRWAADSRRRARGRAGTSCAPAARCAPGERIRTGVVFADPAASSQAGSGRPDARRSSTAPSEETIACWRDWSADRSRRDGPMRRGVRSALVLKALNYDRTGALAAAPTTSLPESPGGERNWDYRYSWIRDSAFAVRSLGGPRLRRRGRRLPALHRAQRRGQRRGPADHVRRRRRAAARARSSWSSRATGAPSRCGSATGPRTQLQLDVLGELVEQSWRWYERGHEPDDDYWRFIVDLVDMAAERWQEPDRGIWEWRGEPKHFVHSKVMCWVALDAALGSPRPACARRPSAAGARRATRSARRSRSRGYDERRGIFVQAFDGRPTRRRAAAAADVGFVDYDDERMVRTVDAIREGLDADGLLRRYAGDDGLPGKEGAFLACLVLARRVLARQGRPERRGRCSTARWRPPTASGCSRRSTTRSGARCSATSRRRSPTSRTSRRRWHSRVRAHADRRHARRAALTSVARSRSGSGGRRGGWSPLANVMPVLAAAADGDVPGVTVSPESRALPRE